MLDLFFYSDLNYSLFVLLTVLLILFYEVINGFHDTANSVSTLIYTRSISANFSVFISGIFNFLGVLLGGLTVSYAIVHLLPDNLLLMNNALNTLSMVFSILLSAIIWNLSTWYFCLPASSSHSLIGGIIGVSLINSFIQGSSCIDVFNASKMISIFLSLILSPVIGLVISGIFIFCLRCFFSTNTKFYRIHMTPLERKKIDGKKNPPFFIRIILILSSIGVSYAHGANDGQKGIGLIMLILISVMPSSFLVNLNSNSNDIIYTRNAINNLEKYYLNHMIEFKKIEEKKNIIEKSFINCHHNNIIKNIKKTQLLLHNISNYHFLNKEKKIALRHNLLCIANTINDITKLFNLNKTDQSSLNSWRKDILITIEYAPIWVIFIIASSLSLGTMIGWRRIVITIGEKIGKKRMTYAQAMSAQITTACSIGIASYTGIPVSTTHILSSSVAGTMLIDSDGIQLHTIRNIALAWILTLPVSILLSGFLYWVMLCLI
ncbi:inorganic phosphate transporter [Buchnera aphidicola]|uniref:inorganic phosphate transporter n=1 Tax=Buchnera aphidicola TaxID=9 RepID=UPI003BEF4073